jgi:hypothetical protein
MNGEGAGVEIGGGGELEDVEGDNGVGISAGRGSQVNPSDLSSSNFECNMAFISWNFGINLFFL